MTAKKGRAKDGASLSSIPEAYPRGLQPSMSWSNVLLECAFPFGKEIEREEVEEPARFGSAYHAVMAQSFFHGMQPKKLATHAERAAKQWAVEAEEVHSLVIDSRRVLDDWLRKNEYRIDFADILKQKKGTLFVEQALALKPLVSGRALQPHDADHRYHGVAEGEQPGTLDYAIISMGKRLPVLLLDHKSGEEDFSSPQDKPQLLSLAAAVARWAKADEVIFGANWARRRGMPKVYSERVKLHELEPYERRLQLSLARIGDGSMKPNKFCNICPAKSMCPAQDAELLSKAGDILVGLTAAGGALSSEGLAANDAAIIHHAGANLSKAKKLGILYEVVRKGEQIAKRAREEIRNEILRDPSLLPETPTGEYLVVREYEKENLSKSAIIEAYGRVAGERMIEKLRKDGAITKTKVQQLYPEKERGR